MCHECADASDESTASEDEDKIYATHTNDADTQHSLESEKEGDDRSIGYCCTSLNMRERSWDNRIRLAYISTPSSAMGRK
jgi:hypothetical protein